MSTRKKYSRRRGGGRRDRYDEYDTGQQAEAAAWTAGSPASRTPLLSKPMAQVKVAASV